MMISMRRGQAVLLSLAFPAVLGGALLARSPEPSRFELPVQAALLPADASFVMGVDLERLVASEAYRRFRARAVPSGEAFWAELSRRTGLEPERDLTRLVTASNGNGAGLTVVLGRFEQKALEASLAAAPEVKVRERGIRKIWSSAPRPGQKDYSVAVLEDGVLILGAPADVEAGLDRRAGKGPGLTANAALMALVGRVEPGATFWVCGDQGVMSAAGNLAPQAAGWTIPSVKSVVVSGGVDPELRASIIAGTADEPAAKGVADMVRMLVGLLAVQGAKRPELQELSSGIQVAQQGAEVRIAARATYETLEKLAPTGSGAARPAGAASSAPAPRAAPNP